MVTAAWALLAVWCETAWVAPLLGSWPPPDLLVLLVLARGGSGVSSARLALRGGIAGLARDMLATTRPGAHALAYLACALVHAELETRIRLSGPLAAALRAFVLALVAAILAGVIAAGFEPSAGLLTRLPHAALGALSTALAAAALASVESRR